ncbi:hypothetical protein ABG79_00855 [Caloramator mitchellensis]|uniref:TIGR04086 family membrane protein n=1 Tax=Caloramator mitchellensis TaxID=908809 RepID=A0A0R3K2H3_CALMK|nr:TIGR04086 family membrane protein [Caloramator mitchellensis]KRQ87516.1 hypothetical protein ABG79_00855 [Caloramator mitchellensis]
MSKKEIDLKENLAKIYAKAVLRGIILSLVLLVVMSAVSYLTKLDEGYMSTITWVIAVISISYAAIYGTLRIGKKGFLHGALIGAIYVVLMFLFSFLADKGELDVRGFIIKLMMAIVVGALAGMIGMVIKGSD